MARITYNTTTLAIALLGEEKVEANKKSATRTLRKFLRDELGEGKAVVGKGGRYALEYTTPEIRSLTKKFKAWEIAQEEAKAARAQALADAKAKKDEAPKVDEAPETDEAPIEDDEDKALEGPTDEEIAAMLSDEEEVADEA